MPFSSSTSVLDRLPSYDIPSPTAYIRTNWLKDPTAFGSYSYLPPSPHGASLRRMLAEPVADRLFFTGEATAISYPSTVRGAVESGIRTAGEIGSGSGPGRSVIVIGAGASGLACARKLTDDGFEVTVLEMRDQVGGRVRSEELDGVPAELGASWIQGLTGSPLVGMAKDAGVEIVPFDFEFDFVNPEQRRAGLAGEAQMNKAFRSYDGSRAQAAVDPLSDSLPDRRTPGLQWAITYDVSQEYGADPEELSVLATWEGGSYGGGDALLAGNYADLLTTAAGDLPVQTSTAVVSVNHSGDGVVVGTVDGGSLSSDLVVVTVPIGVLKAGSISFEPELPAVNQQAIDALGAGVLDKLWLAFDEVFWEPHAEMFQWIDPDRPGLWAEWINGNHYLGKPLLMGLNGGSQAADLSNWSDEEVLRSGMSTLEAMYNLAG
ncbi:MAG: FAD-dependent oxidoreductase [Solirubrobacterales bacterium]|nr:FAD-dependent oxidoreductase [Solirubrobacterales bacterium]